MPNKKLPNKKLPNSIRRFIRGEKARIRRDVFDSAEQIKLISELMGRYKKYLKEPLQIVKTTEKIG